MNIKLKCKYGVVERLFYVLYGYIKSCILLKTKHIIYKI